MGAGAGANVSRSSKTFAGLSAVKAATSSVTGKRKRGKASANGIATINEEDEDELGQGHVDARFSPMSSAVRKRTPTATVKGARGRRGQPATVPRGGDEAADSGVDELESPGVLDGRVRKSKGIGNGRKHRNLSVVQDDDDCDEITSATNSVIQTLSLQKLTGVEKRKLQRSKANERHILVNDGNVKGEALPLPSKRKASNRVPKVISAKQHSKKRARSVQAVSAEPRAPVENSVSDGIQAKEDISMEDGAEIRTTDKTTSDTSHPIPTAHNNEVSHAGDGASHVKKPESKLDMPLKASKAKQIRKKRTPLAPRSSPPNEATQPVHHEDKHSPPPKRRVGRPSKHLAKANKPIRTTKPPVTVCEVTEPRTEKDKSPTRSPKSTSPDSAAAETAQLPTSNSLSADSHNQPKSISAANVPTQLALTSEVGTNKTEHSLLPGSDYGYDVTHAYEAELADRLSDLSVAIDVNEALRKRGHITTFEAKRLRQQILDVRREKVEVEARLEDVRKRHGNDRKEEREREKLVAMMDDVRQAVRRGRARAREVGGEGGMSRLPLEKGLKASLWENAAATVAGRVMGTGKTSAREI